MRASLLRLNKKLFILLCCIVSSVVLIKINYYGQLKYIENTYIKENVKQAASVSDGNVFCTRLHLNNSIIQSVGQEAFNTALVKVRNTTAECKSLTNDLALIFVSDVFLYKKNGKLNKTIWNQLKQHKLIDNDNETVLKQNEYFHVRLDGERLKESFNIQNETLWCNLSRFDKVYGQSEVSLDIETFETHILDESNSYSYYLNKSGFYSISCNTSEYRNVFNDLFIIFPYRMKRLQDERRKYKVKETKINFYAENENKYKYKRIKNPIKMKRKMSVLLLGFDSTSYVNFNRSYPLTNKLLVEKGIIYSDFNSVGINTFPNMIPFLTGITVEQQPHNDLKTEIYRYLKMNDNFFDKLPYIWNEYENQDYFTMYQLDSPSYAAFNYKKQGFKGRPTGFYGRPFWIKYYSFRTGPYLCHNGKHMFNTYFELIENFVKRMNDIKENKAMPYFSFNFLTDYTHNTLAAPPQMDVRLRDMLDNFEKNGYLDDTLVVMFGDHGSRLSKFAVETEIGKAEKYRPFLSMILPKSMSNTQFAKNAIQNENRLISMFDLHQTFIHFLELNNNTINENVHNLNVKKIRHLRGMSLFEKIPLNRTCFDALIPVPMCTCGVEESVSIEEFQKKTQISIDEISNILLFEVVNKTERVRNVCTAYKFEKINSIKRKPFNDQPIYFIEYSLQPGDSIFNVAMNISKEENNSEITYQLYGSVIRTSIYGNQSFCIEDWDLKNYCYCNDYLKS